MNYFLFLLLVFVILYKFIHIYEGFDGGCIRPIVPNFSKSQINYENIKNLYSSGTNDISEQLNAYIEDDFKYIDNAVTIFFRSPFFEKKYRKKKKNKNKKKTVRLYDEANCHLDYLNL